MKNSRKSLSFILVIAFTFLLYLPLPTVSAEEDPLITLEVAGATRAVSEEIKIKSIASSEWELSKQVLGHAYFGNEEVTYELTFNHLSLHDDCSRPSLEEVLFTDYLPPSATFVRATLGGKYDPETHTVTWVNPEDLIDNPTLFGPDTPYKFTVIVKYPQATNVTKVIHRTTAEYTSAGEENPIIMEAQLIHGFAKIFDK